MHFIQTYFECFRDSGINTVFRIYRMRGTAKVAAHTFDHCTHDGVSALTEMAREFPAAGFAAPTLALKPMPGLAKRLWELAKWYGRFYPFMPPKWKTKDPKACAIVSGVVEVPGWNLPHPISANTRLLAALDRTSLPFLTNAKASRVWMTPVGLYTAITRDVAPANRVSFIDLKVTSGQSLRELQDQAKRQLKELNYWGTLLTMYLSVLFGRRLFTWFSKYVHLTFRRTGTFSNLGEWNIPGLAPDEWWVFGEGVVAKMSPVEGTAVVVNGRLGLSVHFHPCVGLGQAEAQAFTEAWMKNYLELSAAPG